MEEKFDGMFMTVVNDSKGIDGFLSNLFSFMRRKTDFFSTPDAAREYVLKYFEEQNRIYQDNKRKEEQKQKHREEQKKREEEKRKAEEAKKNAKVVEITDEEAEAITSGKPVVKEEPKPLPVPARVEDVKKEGKADEPKDDDDKGLIPVNNGSVTDQYIWTQTLTEVTVNIFIPDGVASRCFKVNVTTTHLKITLNGKVHLEGEFHQKIKADGHVWVIDTFEKRRCIILTFEKFENQSWWKCVLKGEEEINTRKVEPENSQLSDLDDETRPTVEKMMLDMRRKAAGLPSLEEEKNRDLLKGFMDKHPEMDFSKCKITGPGQNNFGNGFNFNG